MWSWHYSEKSTYFGSSEVGVKQQSLRFATMEKLTDEASVTKFALLNLSGGYLWGSLHNPSTSTVIVTSLGLPSPKLSCTYNLLWLSCRSPDHTLEFLLESMLLPTQSQKSRTPSCKRLFQQLPSAYPELLILEQGPRCWPRYCGFTSPHRMDWGLF